RSARRASGSPARGREKRTRSTPSRASPATPPAATTAAAPASPPRRARRTSIRRGGSGRGFAAASGPRVISAGAGKRLAPLAPPGGDQCRRGKQQGGEPGQQRHLAKPVDEIVAVFAKADPAMTGGGAAGRHAAQIGDALADPVDAAAARLDQRR